MSAALQEPRSPGRLGRFIGGLRHRLQRTRTVSAQAIPTLKAKMSKSSGQSKECFICTEKFDERELYQPCDVCTNYWCGGCIAKTFEQITGAAQMPPKCCNPFQPHITANVMSGDEFLRYQVLFSEYRTEAKSRVYCPNSDCRVFISDYDVRKQRAEAMDRMKMDPKGKKRDSGVDDSNVYDIHNCGSCSTAMCLKCKDFRHDGEECKFDSEDEQVIAQMRKWGYKQCPRCGFGVRRMWGCSHMACVCGAHFCWYCERNFYTCEASGDCGGDEDDYDEDDSSESEEDDEDAEMGEEKNDDDHEESGEDNREPANADETAMEGVIHSEAAEPTVQDSRTGNALEASNLEAQNSITPKLDTTPPSPAPQRRRSVNLDRGSDRYWEQQSLDFGDEPDDSYGGEQWGCTHEFAHEQCNALRKPVEPVDTTKAVIGNDVSGSNKRPDGPKVADFLCWDCWQPVVYHKERKFQKCILCYAMRCAECEQLWEKTEDKRATVKEDEDEDRRI